MRNEPKIKEHTSFEIIPRKAWGIRKVSPMESYRLHVEFMDGVEGFVDMSKLIKSNKAGVFKKLEDKEFFAQVYLEYGAVIWQNELDLAPDAMYDAIKKQGEWML